MEKGQTPSSADTGGSSKLRDELAGDARHLKDTATERARQEADKHMGEAARIAHSVSSALARAATDLGNDDNVPAWLSSAARQAAARIDRVAIGVEGRNVDDIGRQLNGFARSSPATFLTASAAAGFAAARLLRAGSEHRHHDNEGGAQRAGVTQARTGSGDQTTPDFEASYGGTGSCVRQREGAGP